MRRAVRPGSEEALHDKVLGNRSLCLIPRRRELGRAQTGNGIVGREKEGWKRAGLAVS